MLQLRASLLPPRLCVNYSVDANTSQRGQDKPLASRHSHRQSAAMRIALYEPEIAGNVGAVLRLGACLGAAVDLIEPMGFEWSA